MLDCVHGQLFDVDNHVNRHAVDYIFNTEGHLFPVSALLRRAVDPPPANAKHSRLKNVDTLESEETGDDETKVVFTLPRLYNLSSNVSFSFLHSVLVLVFIMSCQSLLMIVLTVDIKSRWRHNWKSAQVVNSHLVCDRAIRQPGFDLPRQQWSLLNRFRTEQGHCGACRRKWRLTDTDLCPCGETQTMSHMVELQN